MAVLASDTFNRADSGVTLGSADVGGAYSTSGGAGYGISSNKAYLLGNGAEALAMLDIGTADAIISCTVTTSTTKTNRGLCGRASDDVNLLLVQLTVVPGVNRLRFFQCVAGGYTELAGVDSVVSLTTAHHLVWVLNGTNHRVYLDGALQINYTGATALDSNTKFGLEANVGLAGDNDTNDGRWDDLRVTTVVTDAAVATGAGAANAATIAAPPTLLGVSAQAVGSGTGSFDLIPDVSALTLLTGDILIAQVGGSPDPAAAITVTPPASQGWTAVTGSPFEHATGRPRFALLWKRWGAGDTDDSTPTFSVDYTGTTNESAQAVLSVWRGCVATGAPWEAVASTLNGADSATFTAPDATSGGTERTSVRFYAAGDDCAIDTPSEGTAAYAGANYDFTTQDDHASGCSYLTGEGSGAVGTATMVATANVASKQWIAVTLILVPVVIAATTDAAAGLASGTGAANSATGKVAVTAGSDASAGTAYDATVTTGTNAAAEVAAGAGVSNNATSTVSTSSGSGVGTGAGNAATGSLLITAVISASTGTAYDATVTIGTNAAAEAAAGAGTAHAATGTVATSSGSGSGTGAGNAATGKVAVGVTNAASTGAAENASASVTGATNVNAVTATGAGTAYDATTTATTEPATAYAAGAAYDATVSTTISVDAAAAEGTGAAYDAVPSTEESDAAAGVAVGVGAAYDVYLGEQPDPFARTITIRDHGHTVTLKRRR